MERNTGTVADWLIEEELADYSDAVLFLADTLREFKEDRDLENLDYSLYLLYEAQKDKSSELLENVISLRNAVSAIRSMISNIELDAQKIISKREHPPAQIPPINIPLPKISEPEVYQQPHLWHRPLIAKA